MVAKRSFCISAVQNVSGCVTKFAPGRYLSGNPGSAAKKAFTRLCNLKNIKGKCTFVVTVKETTSGSKGKEFTYKIERSKLKKPLIMMEGTDNEFKIEFETKAKKHAQIEKCKEGRARTPGPMKKKSRRAKKAKKAVSKSKKNNNMNNNKMNNNGNNNNNNGNNKNGNKKSMKNRNNNVMKSKNNKNNKNKSRKSRS